MQFCSTVRVGFKIPAPRGRRPTVLRRLHWRRVALRRRGLEGIIAARTLRPAIAVAGCGETPIFESPQRRGGPIRPIAIAAPPAPTLPGCRAQRPRCLPPRSCRLRRSNSRPCDISPWSRRHRPAEAQCRNARRASPLRRARGGRCAGAAMDLRSGTPGQPGPIDRAAAPREPRSAAGSAATPALESPTGRPVGSTGIDQSVVIIGRARQVCRTGAVGAIRPAGGGAAIVRPRAGTRPGDLRIGLPLARRWRMIEAILEQQSDHLGKQPVIAIDDLISHNTMI
jgi:hypothetical protein